MVEILGLARLTAGVTQDAAPRQATPSNVRGASMIGNAEGRLGTDRPTVCGWRARTGLGRHAVMVLIASWNFRRFVLRSGSHKGIKWLCSRTAVKLAELETAVRSPTPFISAPTIAMGSEAEIAGMIHTSPVCKTPASRVPAIRIIKKLREWGKKASNGGYSNRLDSAQIAHARPTVADDGFAKANWTLER